MNPFLDCPDGVLYHGHVLEALRSLPAGSVHCVVTSPPYWSLRDYKLEPTVWGGDLECEHDWGQVLTERKRGHPHGQTATCGNTLAGVAGVTVKQGQFCQRCGGWLGNLGHEPTPEMFVEHIVQSFREIRRVLRDDGVIWLNLGDSYAGSGGAHTKDHANPGLSQSARRDGVAHTFGKHAGIADAFHDGYRVDGGRGPDKLAACLKPKDLIGMPWRVALALQADGWYLRQDIIWHKPNCMPESVTDRPTKAHEYIFLFSKTSRYYFDGDAIREAYNPLSLSRYETAMMGTAPGARKPNGDLDRRERERQVRDPNPLGRNCRSVWTIATESYKQAHFATFPTEIPRRAILAGSSEAGCCPECGSPWKRVIERTGHVNRREEAHVPGNTATKTDSTRWAPVAMATDEWIPGCTHDLEAVPCVVLDPFAGSGTVAAVARSLGRRWIGIDLSRPYLELSRRRIEGVPLPMNLNRAIDEAPALADNRSKDLCYAL